MLSHCITAVVCHHSCPASLCIVFCTDVLHTAWASPLPSVAQGLEEQLMQLRMQLSQANMRASTLSSDVQAGPVSCGMLSPTALSLTRQAAELEQEQREHTAKLRCAHSTQHTTHNTHYAKLQ